MSNITWKIVDSLLKNFVGKERKESPPQQCPFGSLQHRWCFTNQAKVLAAKIYVISVSVSVSYCTPYHQTGQKYCCVKKKYYSVEFSVLHHIDHLWRCPKSFYHISSILSDG